MVIGSSSVPHLVLCNICNREAATIRLNGYMEGSDEPVVLLACKPCALKALDTEDHE